MKKVVFSLIVLINVVQLVFSGNEFKIHKDFPNRILIITLLEEDLSKVLELEGSGNEELIKKYKADIALYNENIKYAFKEYFGDKPQEFLPQSKVEAKANEELLKYSVLTLNGVVNKEGVDFFEFVLNSVYKEDDNTGKYLYKINQKFLRINVQSEVPSRADMLLLIHKMKVMLALDKGFDRKKLDEVLSKKYLLIDKGFTKLTDEQIKKVYPFPYKFCTSEEIFELAEKADINSLYLKLCIENRNGQRLINFMIVECENGRVLSRCNVSGLVSISMNESSEHAKNMKAIEQARRDNKIYTGPRGGDFIGKEIIRLYTAKAELKKAQLRNMASKKRQLKYFHFLIVDD